MLKEFLKEIDPRVKIFSLFVLTTLILLLSLNLALFLSSFFLFLYLILGLPAESLLKNLKGLSVFFVMAFLAQIVFSREPPFISLVFFKVSYLGLQSGLLTLARLVSLVCLATFLTEITQPAELAWGFEGLFAPLKRFKLPVSEIALSVSLAWRYVSLLKDEAERVKKVHQARGLNLNQGIVARFKQATWVAIPLLVNSFEKAERLAEVMEVRGFGISPFLASRTRLKIVDYAFLLAILLFFVGLMIIRSYFG